MAYDNNQTAYEKKKTSKREKSEKDYKSWTKKHNLKTGKDTKSEFETVQLVFDKYQSSKKSRRNNCYWSAGSSTSGTDWLDWWDKQEKSWLMWFKPMPSNEFKSNVKSPATTGRIESTMHKLKKLNIKFAALPNDEGDVDKTKIAQIVLDWIFQTSDMRTSLVRWWKDALIHGSAFARLYIMSKYKEQQFPKDNYFKLSDEEKEALEGKDDKVIWNEKKLRCVFKGVVLQIIPIHEYYPDPNARCNHGVNYEAQYGIWKRVMHIDDIKTEYGYIPGVKNLSKIKEMGYYRDDKDDIGVFPLPTDIENDELCQVLEFEDQMNDRYIVTVNDIDRKSVV